MDQCASDREREVELYRVTWRAFCKDLVCIIRSYFYKTDRDYMFIYVCVSA